MHFAFAIILIVPALRMLYVKTQYEWMNDLTLFQRVDAIMWGCVFAMYHDKLLAFTQRMAAKAKFWLWIPFLAIPALSAFSLLNHYYGWLIVPFGNTTGTIADIAIGFIILITIHYSNNIVFKTLNAKPLDYIGKLSYSLYIWQQLFFSAKLGFTDMFPLNVVLIAIVALMSFYLIEKPFLKLRFKVLPE
jgi:peptidoglycan/LPS O-acetylase OafA/YrhL